MTVENKTTNKKRVPFLGKVHLTYIRAQMNSVSAEEIAKDLKQPVKLIQRQIEIFRQEDALAAPSLPKEGAGQPMKKQSVTERFQQISPTTGLPINGVAVMTPQQSQLDDEAQGTSPFSCGALTEAQRQYIQTNSGKLPLEQIAKDTGLMPYVVRQILGQLNPQEVSREKFLTRNRKTIHKLRPNEPIR